MRARPDDCSGILSCSRRHDAYRDVALLQKLYDIAEFKAALAISLMEEDS